MLTINGRDTLAGRPGDLSVYEFHIQFQHIDRHFCEHIQRRVTAAEIVHLDNESQLVQTPPEFLRSALGVSV